MPWSREASHQLRKDVNRGRSCTVIKGEPGEGPPGENMLVSYGGKPSQLPGGPRSVGVRRGPVTHYRVDAVTTRSWANERLVLSHCQKGASSLKEQSYFSMILKSVIALTLIRWLKFYGRGWPNVADSSHKGMPAASVRHIHSPKCLTAGIFSLPSRL